MAKSAGTGGGSRGRERRGSQYGNTRGKERQRRRADLRELDPRYRTAMEETRAAQAALDAIIEEQKQSPALGATAGALIDARMKEAEKVLRDRQTVQAAEEKRVEAEEKAAVAAPKPAPRKLFRDPEPIMSESGLPMYQPLWRFEKLFDPAKLPQEGDGEFDFAVTFAIKRLKQGYHITAVLKECGVGVKDIPEGLFDELGWGIRPE
jgi:hypothetical protein